MDKAQCVKLHIAIFHDNRRLLHLCTKGVNNVLLSESTSASWVFNFDIIRSDKRVVFEVSLSVFFFLLPIFTIKTAEPKKIIITMNNTMCTVSVSSISGFSAQSLSGALLETTLRPCGLKLAYIFCNQEHDKANEAKDC